MNTLQHATDSDRAVTESADRAEFAARAAERLMATGRAIGLPDDVIVETALRAVREVQQDIVRDGPEPAAESRKDDGVREILKGWFADRDLRTHPAPLDHAFDKHAKAYTHAEHPGDWCNRRDCDVAPRVAVDGRALWNSGRHRTYTRVLTTDYGTVAHVSIGREVDVAGLAERGAVYLVLSDQDAEIEEETFDVSLTADEADELADALTSRAKELRRLEQAESDEAAEAAVLARFPQLADGPAADPESA